MSLNEEEWIDMKYFLEEYLRKNLTVSVNGTSGYQQDGFKVCLSLEGKTFSEDTYYLD